MVDKYPVFSGSLTAGSEFRGEIKEYLEGRGFVELDSESGYSRGVYGSPLGTVVVAQSGDGLETRVSIGAASDFFGEFQERFRKISLRKK